MVDFRCYWWALWIPFLYLIIVVMVHDVNIPFSHHRHLFIPFYPLQDGVGVFPVVGVVTAGNLSTLKVAPKTVVKITTGSPLPAGANAVVMVENTKLLELDEITHVERRIEVLEAVKPGADVRPIGCDIAKGDTIYKVIFDDAESSFLCILSDLEFGASCHSL